MKLLSLLLDVFRVWLRIRIKNCPNCFGQNLTFSKGNAKAIYFVGIIENFDFELVKCEDCKNTYHYNVKKQKL